MMRFVEVIGKAERNEPIALSDLLAFDAVILLGDPGSGKTHSFKAAVAADALSEYWEVRRFLLEPRDALKNRTGSTIFLDALDEATIVANGVSVIDALAGRLLELGKPKFRLSCRPIDWKGPADQALLASCAPDQKIVVARLLPLDNGQVKSIVEAHGVDYDQLDERMRQASLQSLLHNPQSLNLIVDLAKQDHLPRSRFELYDQACVLLAAEANPRLQPRFGKVIPTSRVIEAAEAICAAVLLGGQKGISLAQSYQTPGCIALEMLAPIADPSSCEAALRSRLFSMFNNDQFEPQHRTVAEFLGGRFLSRQVAQRGFPITRAVALMCGDAGEPHPSLRGMFAWFATHLPNSAYLLVPTDPYGVAMYGDPSRLPPVGLRALFQALKGLSARDPFFRAGTWSQIQFGVFSVPDLVVEFRAILKERPTSSHLRSCVLDALEEGAPRPELLADLQFLLLDDKLPDDDRVRAVDAFVNAASTTSGAAANLARQLINEPSRDPHALVSAHLFLRLYPGQLGDADLISLLNRYDTADDDRDPAHLGWRLPKMVPAASAPSLLDALASSTWATERKESRRRYAANKLARYLLPSALKGLCADDAARLIKWLPLLEPIRKVVESDESDVIRYRAPESKEGARCGSPNIAVPRIGAAFAIPAICPTPSGRWSSR